MAFVISMATAIVCLSLVVVTGFVGQLSLAQMALAGFGAWVAGRLAVAYDWNFFPAMIVGALAVVPLGVLVALPALRTRGINLAVLTFGLAVVIGELVLGNSALTGGFEGTKPEPPTLFGLEIDAFSHPGRYGLVVLVVLTLLSLMVANLRRGRSGLRLLAVRSNERAAAALGVSVPGAKVYAFGLGAAIAGFGGILLAFCSVTISYPAFGGFASIQVVVQSVIGGIGFVIGPLFAGQLAPFGIGARLGKVFGFEQETLDLISGALLVLILFANPNGIAYATTQCCARVADRRRRSRPLVAGDDNFSVDDDVPDDDEAQRRERCHPRDRAPDRPLRRRRRRRRREPVDPPGGDRRADRSERCGQDDRDRGGDGFRFGGGGDDDPARRRGDRPLDAHGAGASRTRPLVPDARVVRGHHRAGEPVGRLRRPQPGQLRDRPRPARHAAAHRRSAAVVREFGLVDDLDRMPDELSNGRRRLVAIARSIAASPSVLLLDEPAAGLTTTESAELGLLIRRLASEMGLAVLLDRTRCRARAVDV